MGTIEGEEDGDTEGETVFTIEIAGDAVGVDVGETLFGVGGRGGSCK